MGGPNAELAYSSLFCRHCCNTIVRHDRLAGHRASGRQGDSSATINCRLDMQGVNIFAHHVTGVQYDFNFAVHIVRIQNPKNPGEFQWSQIHWFHHVFNVHRLVGIFAHLFWYKQWLQGNAIAILFHPDRTNAIDGNSIYTFYRFNKFFIWLHIYFFSFILFPLNWKNKRKTWKKYANKYFDWFNETHYTKSTFETQTYKATRFGGKTIILSKRYGCCSTHTNTHVPN